jgi:ribosomal protein S18 acetylase RimI-like enzyme
MPDSHVRIATRDDEVAVVDVITLGFSADPMARWSFPVVRAFGGAAFDHQSAYCVDGYAGAALWLPPGVESDGERLFALMQAHAAPHVRADSAGVFEKMGEYHPTDPHWYLPLIAVDPAVQGKGHGAALMRAALERCDRDGQMAYLESSNPRNISLYKRHGFEVLGTIQVGSSPTVTPMARKPQGR